MKFRVFTYMQNGSIKTAMIEQEAINNMGMDPGAGLFSEYFIGLGVNQWVDHGTVDIDGPAIDILSEVMISD